MLEKRHYVRMPTVFPVELEISKRSGEKYSPHLLQAFTRDISAGGMCLELKSFGKETEKLLSVSDTHLALTINTTFAKNPIRAIAKIVWLSKQEAILPVRYLIGVSYTQIDPKAKRRILKHAKRLLWVPRLTAAAGIFAIVLLTGFFFHNQSLISENKILVRQLVESASAKSDITASLTQMQKRKSLLDRQLIGAKVEIQKMQSAIRSLEAKNLSQKENFEAALTENQVRQKTISEELKKIQENRVKLEEAYKNLNNAGARTQATVLGQMVGWIRSHQNLHTGLVASFEGDAGLEDIGFTYDQSLVCQTFLLFHDFDKAAAILSFYESRALASKNGYFSAYNTVDGRAAESTVRVGPNIWLGIAALQYEHRVNAKRFLPLAERIGDWVIGMQDAEGGLKGGPDVDWYSTEHHLDAYAFFQMLYSATGDLRYKTAAEEVLGWLKKYAYTMKEKRLNRGKGDATIATDTFSWAIAALGPETLKKGEFDPEAIIEFAEQHCEVSVDYKDSSGKIIKIRGFDFAKAEHVGRGGIISTEWTAQVVVTYRILSDYFRSLGDAEKASLYLYKANFYLNELQKLILTSPSRTGQGRGCLPYASVDNADTGHGWRTPKGRRTGSLSGTAYGIFAWTGYNPFQLDNKSEVT